MNIEYCFSSPDGDIPLSPRDLDTPFKITFHQEHPTLVLKDYFKALEESILVHNKNWLSELAGHRDLEKIIIRSEKHGALYHIASIDLCQGEEMKRFGLCSAVTDTGKNSLSHEAEIIARLNQATRLPYLPQIFSLAEIAPSGGRHGSILVALMEWFDDYHEWHFHRNESGRQRLIIWDQQGGYRIAADYKAGEIYRQAAKILTLYYDLETYRQIYPWHHAAGDFIVKTGEKTEVRLTTARRYDCIMAFPEPIIAAVYFFLNLTVSMRLDRLEGTGDLIWVDEAFLNPVLEGFLEALSLKEEKADVIAKLPGLLKSFGSDELEKLLYSLLPLYEKGNVEEFPAIRDNLPGHALELHKSLRVRLT